MTTTSYFDRTLAALRRWDHLGFESLSNGTILIGRVPHVAPQAWLHEVYAPATPEQLGRLASVSVPVHAEFRSFLSRANGMHLFSGHLCIYGIRSSYARSGDARWQPFDIVDPNTVERMRGAPRDAVFVGVDVRRERAYAILATTGEVIMCSLHDPEVLQRWESFGEMLVSEVERLAPLCDEAGRVSA